MKSYHLLLMFVKLSKIIDSMFKIKKMHIFENDLT